MADTPTFNPNPYANFDPSQWSNPYSLYQNQALPWPSSYVGMPTDAMGRPIAAPQGMTINSAPQAPPAAPAQTPNNGAFSPDQAMRILQGTGQWGLSSPGGNGMGGVNNQAALDRMNQLSAGYRPPQPQAAAPATPAASGGGGGAMDYNTVLAMLANPGNPVTPGATVPQAPTVQPGPGVLQQFMAKFQPAQSGPGSGFQQGFYNSLKGMGY